MTRSNNTVDVVMIEDLGIMGVVLQTGTHISLVLYYDDGFRYEEYMDNDDFVIVDKIKLSEDY